MLLKSPQYRDVLPYFIRSRMMCHFGDEIVETVMRNPELWDPATLLLVQQPLFDWSLGFYFAKEEAKKRNESAKSLMAEGDKAAEQGRLQDALNLYTKLVNEQPGFTDAYIGIAHVLNAAGNPQSALEILNSARRIDPRIPKLHIEEGTLALQLGDPREAEAAFRAALSIDSMNVEAQKGLTLIGTR